MKTTIGSLIRKELKTPDSPMSKAVREFRAYAKIAKVNPKQCKMSVGLLGERFHYSLYIPSWRRFDERSSYGVTIGYLLHLTDYPS